MNTTAIKTRARELVSDASELLHIFADLVSAFGIQDPPDEYEQVRADELKVSAEVRTPHDDPKRPGAWSEVEWVRPCLADNYGGVQQPCTAVRLLNDRTVHGHPSDLWWRLK